MTILITGGAGYIGTHACVEFLTAGYDIVVIDNFINSKPEALQRVKDITGRDFHFYEIDLCDGPKLEQVFIENKIEAVVHFAALKAVGESVEVPLTYYQNNIIGTVILTHIMQKYQVKKLVFSSSATVYGSPAEVPINETAPLHATNPYGRTKWMAEEILKDLSEADSSWKISILRYFNPIGAHISGRLGEDPNDIPNNLLPYITQVAIGKLKQLSVYGNTYPTPDGTGIRDYIHVVDLANGHVQALKKLDTIQGTEVYNLGTGKGYSVFEVIHAFERVTKAKIPYKISAPRSGDIAICYANPEKAEKDLGWVAEKGIEEMCADAWRWQQMNPKGYLNNTELYSSLASVSGDFLANRKVILN